MAQMIQINGKDAYYVVDDIKYAPTFPQEWANNHKEYTGPIHCENCEWFGIWRGVFIGYCANCADYEYNYTRGCGFIDIGKEKSADTENSAMQTYLKNVDLKEMPYVDYEMPDVDYEMPYVDYEIPDVDDYLDK